jgi:hypothetical protein
MVALLLAVSVAQAGVKSSTSKNALSTGVAKPDSAIEAEIRARFAKSRIAKNGFAVRVQNGVATLSGKTDVVQHKAVATRLAKLSGAVRVSNQISVTQAARDKAVARLRQASEGPPKREQRTSSSPVSSSRSTKEEDAAPTTSTGREKGEQPPPPRPRKANLIIK